MPHSIKRTNLRSALAALFFCAVAPRAIDAQTPLRVCATIPDLADLTATVGGDEVDVTTFTKGPQDPHFLEPRPSFILALSRADLYIQVGLELEMGWAPRLLRSARNPQVILGASGFVDASSAISALEVPLGNVDRSAGDVHALGNPHYLLDPLNGLKVARLIRDRLTAQRPEKKRDFEQRYADFEARLATRLLGKPLLTKYQGADTAKLLLLLERGGLARFVSFLESQRQREQLGGWLGRMLPHSGAEVLADHNLWPYFARRFGLDVIDFLEPKPGITPTTRHLTKVIRKAKSKRVRAILLSPYFTSRYAELVARNTGATVVPMAHQVGSRPDCETYLDLIEYNVDRVAAALRAE